MDKILTSVITSKGQTTIPQIIRQELGIKPGDTVTFVVKGSQIIIQKFQVLILATYMR